MHRIRMCWVRLDGFEKEKNWIDVFVFLTIAVTILIIIQQATLSQRLHLHARYSIASASVFLLMRFRRNTMDGPSEWCQKK